MGRIEGYLTRDEVIRLLGISKAMYNNYTRFWGLKPDVVLGAGGNGPRLYKPETVQDFMNQTATRRTLGRHAAQDGLVETREMLKEIGVSRETMHNLIRQGMIPEYAKKRYYRWRMDSVLDWLQKNKPALYAKIKARQEEKEKE